MAPQDQLTLSKTRGTDYAHLITTGTPGFSDLSTAMIKGTYTDTLASNVFPIKIKSIIQANPKIDTTSLFRQIKVLTRKLHIQ